MATDLEVQKMALAGMHLTVGEHRSTNRSGFLFAILRRAFEQQRYFACEEVESVAKTTAFNSPVALALEVV